MAGMIGGSGKITAREAWAAVFAALDGCATVLIWAGLAVIAACVLFWLMVFG